MGRNKSEIKAKYEDQLPKPPRLSFSNIFIYLSGFSSIIGLVASPFFSPNNTIPLFYNIFLISLITLLLVYIFLKEKRKLNRYAQSVYYIHYVNHILRDYLAELHINVQDEIDVGFDKIDNILQDVVSAIATCYSILTGKKCRCTIKELKDDLYIITIIRDNISKISARINDDQQDTIKHSLNENTDFYNLWYAINGCSRYYLSNNLVREWKNRRYKNSSFKVYDEPEVLSIFGYQVAKWTLPYKSTLVLPIRYVSQFNPPHNKEEKERSKRKHNNWNVWGFLCIDSNSRNVFDAEFAPELGAAFADLLYIFYSQIDALLDIITTPNKTVNLGEQ